MTSATTITTTTDQKSGGLDLPLCIFLTLLAIDAVSRVWQRVQPLVRNILSAIVTHAECLGRAIKPSQSFVQMPEESSLLACKEKCFFSLHRVGALIGHMERVRAQVAVGALRRRAERLVVMPELFQHATTLLHQSLLEMIEHLLGQRLEFLDCNG